MRLRQIVLLTLVLAPNCSLADECTDLIALSRVHGQKVQDASEVEANANQFCSEYQQYKSQSSSHDFGASYKFLSATYADGNASAEVVASKFCSAASGYKAKSSAYGEYIDSIAPGAFSSYNQCVALKDKAIFFRTNAKSFLPKEFTLSAYNGTPGKSTARLRATGSDGVQCNWDKGGADDVQLEGGQSVPLRCKRDDYKKGSYVLVTNLDGKEELTLGWGQYDDDGNRIDLLSDLRESLLSLRTALVKANSEIEKLRTRLGSKYQVVLTSPSEAVHIDPNHWRATCSKGTVVAAVCNSESSNVGLQNWGLNPDGNFVDCVWVGSMPKATVEAACLLPQ